MQTNRTMLYHNILYTIVLSIFVLSVYSNELCFPQRSGDIVLDIGNKVSLNVFGHDEGLSRLENVADLFLDRLGSQPINDDYPRSEPKNMFYRGASSISLVNIDGLSSNDMVKMSFLSSLSESSQILSGQASTLSSMVSMTTGVSTNQHGIVGERWMSGSQIVQAFDIPSKSENIYNILSSSSDNQAKIVSISSKEVYTRAHCVESSNADCLSIDINNGNWINSNNDNDNIINTVTIMNDLIDQEKSVLSLLKDTKFSVANDVITVYLSNGKHIIFDLSTNNNVKLYLLELQGIYNVLHMNQDINALSITIASFKMIKDMYDFGTIEYNYCIELLDAFAQHTVYTLNTHYLTVLAIHLSPSNDVQVAMNNIKEQIISNNNKIDFLPNVYGNINCDSINMNNNENIKCISCVDVHVEALDMARKLSATKVKAGGVVTQADIDRYQIVLWLCILLGFVLLIVTCGMSRMPYEYDPMLFSNVPVTSDNKKFN